MLYELVMQFTKLQNCSFRAAARGGRGEQCSPEEYLCATARVTRTLVPSPCESRHQGGRELANASGRLAARPPPLETSPCACS